MKEKICDSYCHPTAIVDERSKVGEGTKIWCFAQIREDVIIGKNCNIGNGVYIDKQVKIGNNVTVHNKSLIYRKTVIGDFVFIGPNVVFTNDKNPKSGNIRDLKGIEWKVGNHASIGASSTILPDIKIGKYSVVGANSLVAKDVPDYALVYGVPARIKGFVCKCGERITDSSIEIKVDNVLFKCSRCNSNIEIDNKIYELSEK